MEIIKLQKNDETNRNWHSNFRMDKYLTENHMNTERKNYNRQDKVNTDTQ